MCILCVRLWLNALIEWPRDDRRPDMPQLGIVDSLVTSVY